MSRIRVMRHAGPRNRVRLTALAGLAGSLCSLAIAGADAPRRCGPKFLSVEQGGSTVLVLCEKSDSIARINVDTGEILTETAVGEEPTFLISHPDGRRLYVSCRRGQEVLELDAESLGTLRRFPLRGDPTGVAVSADGRALYVGVHALDQVAIFDLESGAQIKRLAVGNGPDTLRLEPNSGRVFVTSVLSNPVPTDQPCRNEITVIDDVSRRVVDRIILENANIGRWIDFSADGSVGVVAISRPSNLVPMVQAARGWVVKNGFAVIRAGEDSPPAQLLVDLPNQAYADPHAVVMMPGGGKFYLSSGGLDTVIAVDLAGVREVLEEVEAGTIPRPGDHLGLSRRYVTKRIRVGANPQALALSPDARRLYVANRLDDTITVIDTRSDRVEKSLVLGEPSPVDTLLRGERLFHSAARAFHGQFSCASCHPDGGFDGLQYDLEPDDLGRNVLDNRNLRDVAGTAPFKWNGKNPDLTTQCGTRTAKWIVRTGWLTSRQVVNLAEYIRSIKATVNPFRASDGKLTRAQRRGKALFDRTTMADGTEIAERDRCDFCHTGPKFTDSRRFDVGTKGAHDSVESFDTAHLNGIFESAPYLHDGRAATLEGIWTKHNPDDKHGISSDWNKQQLNDLVEYLKSM